MTALWIAMFVIVTNAALLGLAHWMNGKGAR